MSYPGVDPGDVATMNPVGTQDNSPGEPQKFIEKPDPTGKYDKILVPQEMHEQALRSQEPKDPELEKAVAQAVSDMFELNDEAWRPKIITKFKIACPSGQTCLVKHLNTLDLVEYDLMEELDFFTRKLFATEIGGGQSDESIWASLRDPEKRKRFLHVTGRMMAAASIKPKIIFDDVCIQDKLDESTGITRPTIVFGYELDDEAYLAEFKRPKPQLKKGESYAGWIDFSDRMAFFHEMNKPLGLIEPFREESNALLSDMASSEGDGNKAE